MKKLLAILGALGLVASSGASVVACGDPKPSKEDEDKSVKVNLNVTIKEGAEWTKIEASIKALEITAKGKEAEKQTKSEAAAIEAVEKIEGVSSAAVVKSKVEENVKQIEVKVNFTIEDKEEEVDNRTDISTFVSDLGEVRADNELMIVAQFVAVNVVAGNDIASTDAYWFEIVPKSQTETEAIIRAKTSSTKHKGQIKVTFTIMK